MPVTVSLDADLELLLKEEAQRSGRSFDAVLNDMIRRQLAVIAQTERFVVRARPMGLKMELDQIGLTPAANDLELGAFLEATRRLERSVP